MFKFCCEDCGECWYVGNPRTCKCPDEEPNKKWVGLTDEEIETIYAECNVWDKFEYERMLEAKLKEKNNAT